MLLLRRILALIVKESLTILKDPKSRFVLIGPPIIQFIVFGYAATFDVKDVRYAVWDEDQSSESRRLLARFSGSDNFRLVASLESVGQIDEVVNTGSARVVLHLGPTFSRDLHAGRPATLQVILDGRNSNVAATALGYIGSIVEDYTAELRDRLPAQAEGPRLRLVDRAWYNPNYQSRWYMISALGGLISQIIVTLLASLSVAREREFGTFDQLLVTPLTPAEILIGKAAPVLVFGMLVASVLSAAGVWWFGVPFLGSVSALAVSLFVFLLSIVGVGLFISSLAATMQQAMLGSFLFAMPSVLLSGLTTSIDNMPGWLRAATVVNPLRWMVQILRQIFLEGATLPDVAAEVLPMAAIAAVTLTAAAVMFRKRTT